MPLTVDEKCTSKWAQKLCCRIAYTKNAMLSLTHLKTAADAKALEGCRPSLAQFSGKVSD